MTECMEGGVADKSHDYKEDRLPELRDSSYLSNPSSTKASMLKSTSAAINYDQLRSLPTVASPRNNSTSASVSPPVDIEFAYKTLMEAVLYAEKLVLKGFRGSKTVEEKTAFYDLVTEFDRKIEVYLIDSLSATFPDHKFIGEETTSKNKLTNAPTWIIDPIDGTTNFVHNFPHSAISVALLINKEIVIGVVANPMLDQTFTAIKGKGAFLNGKPIHASNVEDLKAAVVGLEISLAANPAYFDTYVKRYRSCVSQTQGMRCLGSAQLSLCMVALGAWDAYHVIYLFPWDLAAGSLIITEAGGTVMDVDGGKFNCETGRIITAGTATLAKKLVTVFGVDRE